MTTLAGGRSVILKAYHGGRNGKTLRLKICKIGNGPQEIKDGLRYVEAHHLLPLGEGGADDPHNITVVSAHIHRMLHYADVSTPDFRKIREDKKGWGVLPITINGVRYEIRCHPRHYNVVCRYQRR
jgi:hypothetical protein